jgi:hypothetical protein
LLDTVPKNLNISARLQTQIASQINKQTNSCYVINSRIYEETKCKDIKQHYHISRYNPTPWDLAKHGQYQLHQQEDIPHLLEEELLEHYQPHPSCHCIYST